MACQKFGGHIMMGACIWSGTYRGRPAVFLSAYNYCTIWSYKDDWALESESQSVSGALGYVNQMAMVPSFDSPWNEKESQSNRIIGGTKCQEENRERNQ